MELALGSVQAIKDPDQCEQRCLEWLLNLTTMTVFCLKSSFCIDVIDPVVILIRTFDCGEIHNALKAIFFHQHSV